MSVTIRDKRGKRADHSQLTKAITIQKEEKGQAAIRHHTYTRKELPAKCCRLCESCLLWDIVEIIYAILL